jgi:tRNA(Ile)-lysidine synthase
MKKKSLNAKKKIHKKLLIHLKNSLTSKIYKEFNNIVKFNLNNSNFSVAVSGGADSLALVYFSKCYSILNNVKVNYYHVDHKLRKESHSEANKLKFLLKKLDIKCNILKWNGKKPKSNIQSIARTKRYNLIYKECLKDRVNFIFVAHHIDDLYENFIIRLLRGSGLKGLVSFSQVKTNYNNKLKILRPLISFKKNELDNVVKQVFKFKFEDPSNKNTNFKRIRIRNLINYLKSEGLDLEKLRLTINNLRDSNFTINYYVNNNIKHNAKYFKNKKYYILNSNFFNQPHEIVFRSLIKLFKKIGNKYYPPRGKSVNLLLSKFESSKIKKINISGCILEKINNSFVIYEEK